LIIVTSVFSARTIAATARVAVPPVRFRASDNGVEDAGPAADLGHRSLHRGFARGALVEGDPDSATMILAIINQHLKLKFILVVFRVYPREPSEGWRP
jgi:hypothetical protein